MASNTANLPTRANTNEAGDVSDDDAIPATDPNNTTSLLIERLQAWKHMCGYLESYISEVAKDQKTQAKDQEKILKTLNSPLKEGHHFDQALGGVAGLFENLRSNTQAQSTLHTETSKNITGSVLPLLERLHSEIKNKRKEIEHGAGKGSKAVDSARNSSQKHIELLGQHTASFDSAGGRHTAANDPYVVQKQVYHRLGKQILEENNNRSDLIAVQNSFQSFEAHVLQTIQNALNTFNGYMSGQADRQKAMYGDIASTAGRIPPDFEWQGFLKRNGHVLVSPNAPARTIDQVSFPNQNHRATQALIEGSLERKGRGLGALSGYSSGYYAVTPAGFLHEFKDNDNYKKDPEPEHSLYLKDCIIGAVDGVKFSIKGKDTSGGKLSQKLSTSSEYQYKAHTAQDAAQWHSVISSVTSGRPDSLPNSPISPTSADQKVLPINTHTQQQGIVGQPGSATTAPPQYAVGSVPQSATSTHAPQSAISAHGGAPGTAVPYPAEQQPPSTLVNPAHVNQPTVAPGGTVPQYATSPTAAQGQYPADRKF